MGAPPLSSAGLRLPTPQMWRLCEPVMEMTLPLELPVTEKEAAEPGPPSGSLKVGSRLTSRHWPCWKVRSAGAVTLGGALKWKVIDCCAAVRLGSQKRGSEPE